jgi:hypothetical protein
MRGTLLRVGSECTESAPSSRGMPSSTSRQPGAALRKSGGKSASRGTDSGATNEHRFQTLAPPARARSHARPYVRIGAGHGVRLDGVVIDARSTGVSGGPDAAAAAMWIAATTGELGRMDIADCTSVSVHSEWMSGRVVGAVEVVRGVRSGGWLGSARGRSQGKGDGAEPANPKDENRRTRRIQCGHVTS